MTAPSRMTDAQIRQAYQLLNQIEVANEAINTHNYHINERQRAIADRTAEIKRLRDKLDTLKRGGVFASIAAGFAK